MGGSPAVPASFQADTPSSFQADAPAAAPQRTMEDIDKPPVTGIGNTAWAMADGARHFIRDILGDVSLPISAPINSGQKPMPLSDLWDKYVAQPLFAERAKSKELLQQPGIAPKISAVGHELASWIPFAGPMAAQAGEQLGAGDIGGGALSSASALLQGRAIGGSGAGTASLAGKAAGLNKVDLVNGAHALLEKSSEAAKTDLGVAKINVGKSVGALVKDIANADVAETSSRGRMGSVNVAPIHDAVAKGIEKYGLTFGSNPLVAEALKTIESAPPRMSWEMAKDLRTQLGVLMFKAAEGTKQRGVLADIYQVATDQLGGRANDLGKPEEFGAFNKLHSTMMEYAHDGIYGKLLNAESGIKWFDEIKKPSNGPQLEALNQDLKQFGLADNFFKDLAKSHEKTYQLAKQSMGEGGSRFQSLKRHPLTAGTAFLGAQSLPLPGKFVISILAAMKAADMADRVQAAAEMRGLGGAPKITGKFGEAAEVGKKALEKTGDAADELLKRADRGQHIKGASYTDEGLRNTFKIPNSKSLSDLVDAGAIVRNSDGTFSVSGGK